MSASSLFSLVGDWKLYSRRMLANPPARSAWVPSLLLATVCGVAVVHVFASAILWDRALQSFDEALQPVPASAGRDGSSRRFYLDNDPYYWISYAHEMAATGNWRIRYTHIDNVPFGREVHWSQSVSWLLVLFGYVRHVWAGEPMEQAIEGAAIWVNPVLYVLVTVGFSWLISRRMGVVAGVIFAGTFVTLRDVNWSFHPFHLGHHGLHVTCSLGAILCLVLGGLGWVRRESFTSGGESSSRMKFFCPLGLPNRATARKYFAAAGVFTGLGLWIGATVQFFSIAALATGSVLLTFFVPKQLTDAQTDYVPELWRTWTVSAVIVGTFFYLIEYFPSHLAMRLEVNHPLYALSLVCIGELMVRLTRWKIGVRPIRGSGRWWIALAAVGAALVPVLMLAGPVAWYKVRDPEMIRLHSFISEFFGFVKFYAHEEPHEVLFRAYGIVPLFLIGALLLSGPGHTTLYEWAALWLSFFVSLFFLVLMWWQVRWGWHYAVLSIWLMVVVGHVAWRNALSPYRKPLGRILLALLTLTVLVQAVLFAGRGYVDLAAIRNRTSVKSDLIDAVMMKNLGQGLAAPAQNHTFRFICEADLTPVLYYIAGIPSVTSYYWENVEGLHAATQFFADHGEANARRVAQERGLTHVLVSASEETPAIFNYLKTGNASVANARPTLLERLRRGGAGVPSWLELDYELSKVGQRRFELSQRSGKIPFDSRIRVYRIKLNE